MTSIFYHGDEQHVMEACYTCKVQHSIPKTLYEAAMQRRGSMQIYCPNGHTWVYKSDRQISEDEKVRLERDRLKQQVVQKDDEISKQRELRYAEERRVTAYRAVVTRTKNRIASGVCPCCNRTFENLHRHMATKHKDYQKKDEAV